MDKEFYKKVFSEQRMEKYFEIYPSREDLAIKHYYSNIQLSEAFYPLLSIFEVAYRNSLNRELTKQFSRNDWYETFANTPGLRNLNSNINTAKRHISSRNETISPNKVVAELTLGFWVRLLNTEYERILWKGLRKAFPFIPKSERQRKNVSSPVNKIRNFRNRVFHHEPIAWRLEKLEEIHKQLYLTTRWINKDLPIVVKELDRVPATIEKVKNNLEIIK